jgi:molybdate transport system ATP-binding protein
MTVYVTHSATEAVFFGDEIAVIESGAVGQCGSPDELLRRPRSAYVAELMGVNLLRGEVRERLPGGLARVVTADGQLLIPDPGGDGEIFLVVDPREIVLSLEPPAGSARNRLQGAIEELNLEPPLGERVRVALATRPPLVAEVTRQSVESLGLRPGLRVHAAFKATGVIAFR